MKNNKRNLIILLYLDLRIFLKSDNSSKIINMYPMLYLSSLFFLQIVYSSATKCIIHGRVK